MLLCEFIGPVRPGSGRRPDFGWVGSCIDVARRVGAQRACHAPVVKRLTTGKQATLPDWVDFRTDSSIPSRVQTRVNTDEYPKGYTSVPPSQALRGHRLPRAIRRLAGGLLLLPQLACGEVLLPDAGIMSSDGAVWDSGNDATWIADAGSTPDSGIEPDAGVEPDTGTLPDGDVPDTGIDAGAPDSGLLTVQVQIEPGPLGRVEIQPEAVTCPPQCESNVVFGATATLTATPQPGYRFSHWAEDCSGQLNPCTLTPTQPLTTAEAWFQAGGVAWVQAWSDDATILDVAMDAQGAAYVLFSFTDSIVIPTLDVYSGGGFLVLKIDATGAPLWAHHILAIPTQWAAIAVASPHVYVAVSSNSDFSIPPSTNAVPNVGGYDMLVADFDSATGSEIARYVTTEGLQNEFVGDIVADASGFYLGGTLHSSSLRFGGAHIQSTSPRSAFALKIAPTGAIPWALALGGDGVSTVDALALTANGHLYVGGAYSGSDFHFGSTLPAPTDGFAVYVGQMSTAAGVPQWARALYAPAVNIRSLTAVGPDVAVLGTFLGSLVLDATTTLQSVVEDSYDAFLLRLSSVGSFGGAYKFGSDVSVNPSTVHALPSGDIAVSLSFYGILGLDRLDSLLGSETRVSQEYDTYLAVLSPTAQGYRRLWDQQFASATNEYAQAIGVSGSRLVLAVRRTVEGSTPFGSYSPTGRSFLVSVGL